MTGPPVVVTPSEAAGYLRVSRPYIYKLVSIGLLRAVKFGSVVRIRQADLEAFVVAHMTTGQQVMESAPKAAPVVSLRGIRD